MSVFLQFDPKKQPKCKIELHVHLDGAVRLTTIWEVAKKRGIAIKSKTLQELYEDCSISQPSDLEYFLRGFNIILPVLRGDTSVTERIAYEICEDLSNQGVMYAEVRYNPHLFCDEKIVGGIKACARSVVESVIKGFKRGEKDFDIKIRSILCCIRGRPEWSQDILDFCKEFSGSSAGAVVGIDIAGDEAKVMASAEDIRVFREAAELGIHRTAHAAEAGPASNVNIALDDLKVERIGHGYHVVDDDKIFQKCLDEGIHFETCPFSSYLTGSVPVSSPKHPIIKFAEDNASFSISRDDPFIIQKTLDEEYSLLRTLGLRDVHFFRANLNAARKCFLPKSEKDELIKKLFKLHAIANDDPTAGAI